MKHYAGLALVLVGLGIENIVNAQIVTLYPFLRGTNGVGILQFSTDTLTIGSNQVAHILQVKADPSRATLTVHIGDTDFTAWQFNASSTNLLPVLPVIAGPATVQLVSKSAPDAYVTVQITEQATESIPSTAVVIPSDTNGPVQIILESSSDLITWTPALPGTYGTTTDKRFFRVRAVR